MDDQERGEDPEIIITQTGIVADIIQGDTIMLTSGETVKLIGYLIDPHEESLYYQTQAVQRLKGLILNKEIELERDITDRDKYGSLLRYIYYNETNVNFILVHEGYAKSYPVEPDVKYKVEFIIREDLARTKRLGIWEHII